jgi:hypothetical protein
MKYASGSTHGRFCAPEELDAIDNPIAGFGAERRRSLCRSGNGLDEWHANLASDHPDPPLDDHSLRVSSQNGSVLGLA